MKLPRAIRTARESAKLSQVELADKMGVAPSTVAGWELGTHGIRMDRVVHLAKVLGTSVAKLVEAA